MSSGYLGDRLVAVVFLVIALRVLAGSAGSVKVLRIVAGCAMSAVLGVAVVAFMVAAPWHFAVWWLVLGFLVFALWRRVAGANTRAEIERRRVLARGNSRTRAPAPAPSAAGPVPTASRSRRQP